jgi:hypothetical protein
MKAAAVLFIVIALQAGRYFATKPTARSSFTLNSSEAILGIR